MDTALGNGMNVGFIGLGSMGLGMARQLVGAGHKVMGFDIRPEAMTALAEAGGHLAPKLAAVAHGADALVVMVVSAAQVEEVLFGPEGAAGGLMPGAVVMLSSTVPPSFVRRLGERLENSGIHLLDAPVSGGAVRAADGGLTIMASGKAEAFSRAEPLLEAMAARIYRLGDAVGIGSTVKSVNQLLAGVHIAVAAEAMAYGVRSGADPKTLFEVISNSAGNSWMFENRVPHMIAGDYTPLSAVEIFVKDLGLVLDSGRELRFPLPLAAAAHQLFLGAAASGHGSDDDAAVVKVYEAIAGISISGNDGS